METIKNISTGHEDVKSEKIVENKIIVLYSDKQGIWHLLKLTVSKRIVYNGNKDEKGTNDKSMI